MPLYCFADETENYSQSEVVPMYSVVIDTDLSLNILGNSAKVGVKLSNHDDVEKAEIRVVLERKTTSGYSVVKTWRDQTITFNSLGKASWSRGQTLTDKGEYRIRVSGIVYKNGNNVSEFKDRVSSIAVY